MPLTINTGSAPGARGIAKLLCEHIGIDPSVVTGVTIHDDGGMTFSVSQLFAHRLADACDEGTCDHFKVDLTRTTKETA